MMTTLEFLRRQRGLSQRALGKKILYENSVISDLERGKITATKANRRLKRTLENFFELPLEALLKEAELSLKIT